MSACFVALKDPAADPFSPLDFLCGRGYTRDAALGFLRNNPGFLGRRMSPEAAADLRAAAAGLEVLLAAEDDLPALPGPLTVKRAVPKAGGFEVTDGNSFRYVPADSVRLAAAWAWDAPAPPLNTSTLAAGLAGGIKASLSGESPREEDAGPRDTFFRAELLAGGRRLRFSPEELDFSPLGAEKGPGSLENFRRLLDRLVAPAFGAVRSAFFSAFLARRPLAGLKVAGPAACGADLARLLLLLGK